MTSEPSYVPPSMLLEKAQRELANATRDELGRAEDLFNAYGTATGGVSAVTGARLPLFDECTPLVRYAWLVTARWTREPRPLVPDPQIRTDRRL